MIIKPINITKENFLEFGDLISSKNVNPIDINDGYAKRFDDLAKINTEKNQGKTCKYILFIKKIFSDENRYDGKTSSWKPSIYPYEGNYIFIICGTSWRFA